MTSDNAGGALVVWEESVAGEHKLRAARVTAQGALEAGWPSAGLTLATAAGQQRLPAMVLDAAGGAVVAWYDTRSGSGDIYAQRFTAAGAIAAGWPAAGLAVCTQASEQYAPAILGDGASGGFIAWEDFRGGTTDIYAQRVTGAGAISAGWPANGVALTTASGEQYAPRLMGDGSGGAIVTWFDTRSIGSVVAVADGRREPLEFALYGSRPNPAIGSLRVAFALPDAEPAKVELLDVMGRRLLSRDVGSLGPGRHVVDLQGRTTLKSGIYLVRLTHAGRSLTTTVSVLR
jgi:hypothetical protein